MDNGLVLDMDITIPFIFAALILVVVDNGLVLLNKLVMTLSYVRLNPCCSGQWSSTRPYKTLLIINKLKNFTKEIFTSIN